MTVSKKTTKPIASQLASADTIFKGLNSTDSATFNCKLLFVAPSKHGVRLIVKRVSVAHNDAVYTFPETLQFAGAKAGDNITILAEQRTKDGKMYWNATAISKAE